MEETVKKKKRNYDYLSLYLGVVLLSLSLLTLYAMYDEMDRTIKDQQADIIELKSENARLSDSLDVTNALITDIYKVTWDNIDYWLVAFGISHPEIVKAQIYEETGNLTSSLCRNNHNLFGMRMPAVRETSAIGERNGFAYYGSYIESIQDYALWQHSRYVDETEDYYDFIVRVGYCFPDCGGYVMRLKYIQDHVFSDQ